MRTSLALLIAAIASLATTSVVVAAPAMAAPLQAVTLEQAQTMVTKSSQGRARVAKLFPGPDGLVGGVVRSGSQEVIVWFTQHGKAMLVDGALLGADGDDLAKQALVDQGVQLSPEAALNLAASKATRPILVGRSGPIATVFFDPNCIYCHLFYKEALPEIEAGRLRVRYVIVGVVKESSIPRAASILAAKDPARALMDDETGFDVKAEEGGYAPDATLDPAMKALVEANNALFNRTGARGTPAMLVCSVKTGKVTFIPGQPRDIQSFIAEAAGTASPHCR